MKLRYKIVSLGILGAVAVFLAGRFGNAPIKNLDSSGSAVICFGDSITFGYGAGLGEDYPAMLGCLLERPVVNAGIDGDTTQEALKRLDGDVLERNPRLVIVEFAGNDFLRKVPLELTCRNIEEMVTRIQKAGAIAAIADISAGPFMREYRSAYADIARRCGAIFIPSILSGIITTPSMKSDFLHPNAAGYKLIAERIYKIILPHLVRNQQEPKK